MTGTVAQGIRYCYECDPKRKGGYNHVDCRNGKKDKNGNVQICECCCQTPGAKAKVKRYGK